jgi:hypothetical protein
MHDALQVSLDNKIGVMMDSSAHSFHVLTAKGRKKRSGKWNVSDIDTLKDMVIDQYVDYVKRKGDDWDWYVNFDYIRDCQIIYEMQKLLEKKGIRPVPVYHGDQSLEWLERYCKEGHKLIGISLRPGFGTSYRKRRVYYDYIFNTLEKYGVLAHGFAVTSLSLMFAYPWYSVDSATWAKAAAYGAMIHVNLHRQTNGEIHITDRWPNSRSSYCSMPKEFQKEIRKEVESNGFDFDEIQTDGRMRSLYNVYVFSHKIHELKEAVKSSFVKWKGLL